MNKELSSAIKAYVKAVEANNDSIVLSPNKDGSMVVMAEDGSEHMPSEYFASVSLVGFAEYLDTGMVKSDLQLNS